MKKIFFLFVFLCGITVSQAQELSYGVLIGGNLLTTKPEGEQIPGFSSYTAFKNKGIPVNIGAYVDYQLNQKFSLKANVLYSKDFQQFTIRNGMYAENIYFTSSYMQLQTHVKFDLYGEYNDGLYLLAGPRINTSISIDDKEYDGFYKKTNYAAQAGFGLNFSEAVGIEVLGDFGLSDILGVEEPSAKTIGFYAHLFLNIDALIN